MSDETVKYEPQSLPSVPLPPEVHYRVYARAWWAEKYGGRFVKATNPTQDTLRVKMFVGGPNPYNDDFRSPTEQYVWLVVPPATSIDIPYEWCAAIRRVVDGRVVSSCAPQLRLDGDDTELHPGFAATLQGGAA